ncbi:MAG: NAD(P)H-binding protein [Myxococcaceae bacterium]
MTPEAKEQHPGRPRVAIAGASGFVGRALIDALKDTHDVTALTRAPPTSSTDARVSWCSADLFNLADAERALAGANVAVYLVHSMMPSARLTQGRFEDLDAVCADNFGRAAARQGVGHIVYLGGLLPAEAERSRHLESRFEVEHLLASHGVPVTTLRAGLVVGAGGSSFNILRRLVGRLPFMIGPRWTRSLTQPVALSDVVELLRAAITRPELAGHAYDVGGPDVLTYAQLLVATGHALGRKTRVLPVPVETMRLSLLWVSVITGAAQALVRPLVESLRHDMVARDGLTFQKRVGVTPRSLRVALADALRDERAAHVQSSSSIRRRPPTTVRSVQRLTVNGNRDAKWVAQEYVRWLPHLLAPLLKVETNQNGVSRFFLWPVRRPLLELTFSDARSTPDRQLFFVTGGLLAQTKDSRARLEFRQLGNSNTILAAIHDFTPRLPWFIYTSTQALAHLAIMRRFQKHLEQEGRG